jgi:outer membrane beta-barrel protein
VTKVLMHSLLFTALVIRLFSPAYAGEESLYDFLWLDPDKSVFVLQNKLYEKRHTTYFNTMVLKSVNIEFQKNYGVQLRSGHFFTNELAVEAFYNRYTNEFDTAYQNIQVINGSEPFLRRLHSSYGLNGVYSPFYGKINTFNHIFYFDWSFSVGFGKVNTDSNRKSVVDPLIPSSFEAEKYNALFTGSNLRFYLTPKFHLNVGAQNSSFYGHDPIGNTKSLTHQIDFLIGIGLSF